jgi:hypothetical protein
VTPAPDGRGPEPLRDQIFIAVIYALVGAAMFAYALAPVTDDLGPAQTLVLGVALTPACLAAIRWRAHRIAGDRAAQRPHPHDERQPSST